MKNKGQPLIAILGALSLVLITAGVSLALFDYVKTGTEDNVISTGSITFIYDEETGQGRGVTLADAMPISNELGKAEPTNVFNFKITSNPGTTNIKYTISARKVSEGNILDDVVDLYLTDQTNNGDYIAAQYPSKITQEKTILTFGDLDGYKNSSIEKILYEKTITSSDLTNGKYEQDFRLRMWIDENTDFSDGTYNNQTFKIIVNVNANVDTSVVPSGGSGSGNESGNSGSGSNESGNTGGNEQATILTPTIQDNDNNGIISTGDLVCYSTDSQSTGECFYVFDTEPEGNTRMLAQYNLKVGRIYEYNGESWQYTITPIEETEPGYGYQDSTMNAAMPDADSNYEYHGAAKGIVAFDGTNQYYDGGQLKAKYKLEGYDASNYPEYTDLYDSEIVSEAPTYDGLSLDPMPQNYNINYYVEPYKTKLTTMGVPVNGIKILNFKDIMDSNCYWTYSHSNMSTSCNFVYTTTYWLASLETTDGRMCLIEKDNRYPQCGEDWASEALEGGVRPLISVATSTLSIQ